MGRSLAVTRAEQALDHLDALERLNKIVAGFASMVSHEMRTALVGIQGLSELIRDQALTEAEVRDYAEEIFQEATRINRLIGDMLDLNHLETGRAPLHPSSVDLAAVIRDVVGRTSWTRWQPVFTLELDGAVPPVAGDPGRLSQLVDNLVGFVLSTSRNGARITISAENLGRLVAVSLHSDSLKAVGFEDWLYGRYERYEQRPSAIIGAGLGLAIARIIVELHDGRIWVETKQGAGSSFHFTLAAAG